MQQKKIVRSSKTTTKVKNVNSLNAVSRVDNSASPLHSDEAESSSLHWSYCTSEELQLKQTDKCKYISMENCNKLKLNWKIKCKFKFKCNLTKISINSSYWSVKNKFFMPMTNKIFRGFLRTEATINWKWWMKCWVQSENTQSVY